MTPPHNGSTPCHNKRNQKDVTAYNIVKPDTPNKGSKDTRFRVNNLAVEANELCKTKQRKDQKACNVDTNQPQKRFIKTFHHIILALQK